MYDIGVKEVKKLKELRQMWAVSPFSSSAFSCCLFTSLQKYKNICKSAIFYQLLPFLAAFLASFAVRKHIISSLDLE